MVRTDLMRILGCLAVALAFAPLGQSQVTFTNNNAINLPSEAAGGLGPANPFPSLISVAGYTGTITEIRVTLTGFSHTYTDDVGALFVGPTGARTILFNGPGTDAVPGFQAVNLNLTFRDDAATAIPDNAPFTSGDFLPGQQQYTDQFSAPAPQWAAPDTGHPTTFAGFIGTNPNGNYSLYVEDFVGGDTGSITSWSITIFGITPVPEPTSILLGAAGFGLVGSALRRRWKAKRA